VKEPSGGTVEWPWIRRELMGGWSGASTESSWKWEGAKFEKSGRINTRKVFLHDDFDFGF
jgi:hypothetical protein